MEVTGRHKKYAVREYLSQAKKLDPQKILRGKIYVIIVYNDDNETRGKLILSPDAEVAMHEHTDDNETYYGSEVIDGKLTMIKETCKIGSKHNLRNLSTELWAVVDFRKWKK